MFRHRIAIKKLLDYQLEIETDLDYKFKECINEIDLEKELLVGYPFNFSLWSANIVVGHIRIIPNLGAQVTHIVSNFEGRGFGFKLLKFAVEFAFQNGFNRVWSYVHKKNEKSLAVIDRLARFYKLSDYKKEFNENYWLIEHLNA